jgi:hypothetical protein
VWPDCPSCAVPGNGLQIHFGTEFNRTEGNVNYDVSLKNGFGFTYREGAKVVRQISGDSHYRASNTSFPNSTKYITEIGAAFIAGISYQTTAEVGNDGKLLEQNSQFNLGGLGLGLQINWDGNGLKDIRLGVDTGPGLSVGAGAKITVQAGLMYVFR